MAKEYTIEIPERSRTLTAPEGMILLDLLREEGMAPHTPCGGKGSCGKCKVRINGEEHLACQTVIDRHMVLQLPQAEEARILRQGSMVHIDTDKDLSGPVIAIDLGTTTMVCYLLSADGEELATASALNPQGIYGADVVTRMQAALGGQMEQLSDCVRRGLTELIQQACREAEVSPESIQRIALVGNPCMQQLLMGISPENLSKPPFSPVLTHVERMPAKELFPLCEKAEFLVVPDISGYVGADTMGCTLASQLYEKDHLTLMVDIGTNGEMVMGSAERMIACSTAAGPALEGANIRFGMRGSTGAIDHVKWADGRPDVHVIGEGRAKGICGSGLIDAVSIMLTENVINHRGRIQSEAQTCEGERAWYLTEDICLTQSDVRQVQLAKGAIAAGIELMAQQLGADVSDIDEVLLAGAFGSFIRPESACRIGLLPPVLLPKIRAVGNIAGSGAKLLACSMQQQKQADQLVRQIEFLELASLPDFQRTFGKQTNFS